MIAVDLIQEFLGSTSLFTKCDPVLLEAVAAQVTPLSFAARAHVIHAGQQALGVDVLFQGKVSLRKVDASTKQSTALEMIAIGDHFGEVGTLLRSAQPFDAVAEEASTILRIPPSIVEQLFDRHPIFAYVLAKRLSSRLVQSTSRQTVAPPAGGSIPPPSREPPQGSTPFVQVADYEPTPAIIKMIPMSFIQRTRVLPLELVGNVLTVGMTFPRDLSAVAELRQYLKGVDLRVVAIGESDFASAAGRFRIGATEAQRAGSVIPPASLVFDQQDSERDAEKGVRAIGDEVVNLVNKIIAAGLDQDASDIHIEPEATGVRVRYRVNGVLVDSKDSVPLSFAKGISARLKVLSGLDITERRLPQDGRIGVRVGRRDVDLRLSTLPSSRGETVVMRILDAASMTRPIEQIFYEPVTLAAMRRVIGRPYGAVIVAGPTGSGKSASLYALLQERKRTRPDTNIIMIEDPIEYRLTGVTQVQVNHSVGLGFAQVLRALVRQDPDVIMVGEIRDAETAVLALEAAMTGHLLFTSMHANDCFSVVQRLEQLSCNRTHIAQALTVIVVQRLVRRLCPSCTKLEAPPPLVFESLVARRLVPRSAPVPLPRATGCDACRGTGYAGRIVVAECLQLTDELRTALMSGVPTPELSRLATDSKTLLSFSQCASFLMSRRAIDPTEALLTLAD